MMNINGIVGLIHFVRVCDHGPPNVRHSVTFSALDCARPPSDRDPSMWHRSACTGKHAGCGRSISSHFLVIGLSFRAQDAQNMN